MVIASALSFLGMRGKGIFVREEVGLSVKGKGGFVCGKGFSYAEERTILSEGRGAVIPRRRKRCSQKKELCAQVKETLSVGKLTCVGRRILFRAQGGKFLCARK